MSPSPHPRALRSSEFQTIFQTGKRWAGDSLALWILKGGSPDEATAWGIVVSRQAAGRAVDRNRWKRRIRELLRSEGAAIRPGYRGVVQVQSHTWRQARSRVLDTTCGKGTKSQVRKSTASPDYQGIKKEIRSLLRKAGALQ